MGKSQTFEVSVGDVVDMRPPSGCLSVITHVNGPDIQFSYIYAGKVGWELSYEAGINMPIVEKIGNISLSTLAYKLCQGIYMEAEPDEAIVAEKLAELEEQNSVSLIAGRLSVLEA